MDQNIEIKNGVHKLKKLTDVFGAVALVFLWLKFFKIWGVEKITGIEVIITPYPIVLSMFSQSKAVKKVLGKHTPKRHGELWALVWLLVAATMVVLNAVFPGKFFIPISEILFVIPLVVTLAVQSFFSKLDSGD